MATVKSSGNKYNNNYAIHNTLEYYGSSGNPGTDWDYWTACGVDNTDIEIAKNQMLDTKIKFKHFRGIQMHQVYVQIPYNEINSMNIKPAQVAEYKLVEMIGQYFYRNGLQSVSFVYRNRPGIFIRIIVNATSLRSGRGIGGIGPFVKELQVSLNSFIKDN